MTFPLGQSSAVLPEDSIDEWVWVTDHYDVHIAGLCRVRGTLCSARVVDPFSDHLEYNIEPLSFGQRCVWFLNKWWFEFCVGKHWSHPFDERFVDRRPRMRKFYYCLRRL